MDYLRELENKVKRAVIMSEGQQISADDLDLETSGEDADEVVMELRQVRESAERMAIQRALTMCKDNVSQAADLLGVSRPTLYDLMTRYGLKK